MIKQIMKKGSVYAVIFMMTVSMFVVTLAANAGTSFTPSVGSVNNTLWGGDDKANNIQSTMGVGNNDPREIAANIINIILGFLGILAVVLILFGGFKWMTAAGNEDKVGEAKKLLIAGVVGLIIILAAYSLAAFVLDQIFKATS